MPIREISEDFSIEDIVPYFQPIVDLNSQGVWRYECLARLITQGDKTFLPSEFLYLIEREQHVNSLAANMFVQCASYFHDLILTEGAQWTLMSSRVSLLGTFSRLVSKRSVI